MSKDYYQILGVSKNASKDEIKNAFRKLAHQYHPDKGGGNEAKFKEVSEAYSVLGDDNKRKQYDTFGSASSAGGGQYGGFEGFGGFNPGQGFGGFDFSQFTQGGGQSFEFDLNDILGEFFGGGMGGFRTSRMSRGRNIQTEIQISLVDSILGVEKKMVLGGHKEINIKIPAGIQNGETLKMPGQGEEIKNGKPGDLYIKVYIKFPGRLSQKARDLLEDLRREGL